MHAAQSALTAVERYAALHVAGFQSVGLKFSLTIGTSEKAPLIDVLFQLDDKCSLESCLSKDDGSKSPVGYARDL